MTAVALLGSNADKHEYAPSTGVVIQPDNASQAAGPVLQRLALTTESRSAPQIRDDQYIYVESKVTESEGAGDSPGNKSNEYTFKTDGHRESWHPVSGFKSGRNGLLKIDGDSTAISSVPGPEGDSSTITSYRDLEKLPTDPDALYTKIRNDLKQQHDYADPKLLEEEMFTHIRGMISETVTPPKTAAALYRAAAKIPGVVEVPNAVDGLNRSGVGLAYDKDGTRQMWVFDKKSSEYLGTVSVIVGRGGQTSYLLDAGVKLGTVTWSQAVVKRVIVDQLGDTTGQGITR
jgi:hypothetical protein